MTVKWYNQTPDPPRIPVSYTLAKIHKPTLVGRPIISGCDGPTACPSSFVDKLLQPIAQIQDVYLKDTAKDTADFIKFIENTRVPRYAFPASFLGFSAYLSLRSERERVGERTCERGWRFSTLKLLMDVTSLYTNIPQEDGITLVCQTYENFHDKTLLQLHIFLEKCQALS